MSKRSLVSTERMPEGWLNSDEGHDWFRRRGEAFAAMNARLLELSRARPKGS